MKTSELTGAALDWAVAKCKGLPDDGFSNPEYHIDWAYSGAIIERDGIALIPPHDDINEWEAYHPTQVHEEHYGATPLIAAMRCYVASKLGDEINIPEELR